MKCVGERGLEVFCKYDYKQLSRYSPTGTIEINHFKVSSVDYVRSYSNYITLSTDGEAVRDARHFSFPQILLAGIINDNHFSALDGYTRGSWR